MAPVASHVTSTAFHVVDIRTLERDGLLAAGTCGTITKQFTWGDTLVTAFRASEYGIKLFAGQGSAFVHYAWSRQRFGGERRWFACPSCDGRAAILYGRNSGRFACRACCRIVYQSQRMSVRDRAIETARALRLKIGGTVSLADPLPEERPRYMHERTFRRLQRQAREADHRSAALSLGAMARWSLMGTRQAPASRR